VILLIISNCELHKEYPTIAETSCTYVGGLLLTGDDGTPPMF